MNNKKLKILLFGNPLLRQEAKPVNVFHHKLQSLIDSMAFTLDNREDGAALAANQVGILKRIVIINYEDEYLELINPQIIDSRGQLTKYEGCLSLPRYIGLVPRAEFVTVKYCDRDGKEKVIERNGNLARCLQHEIDHLDGILFIDRMIENFLTHQDTNKKISLSEVKELADGKTVDIQKILTADE